MAAEEFSKVEELGTVEEILAAWQLAVARTSDAVECLRRARLILLEAGFGDDHPICKRLVDEAIRIEALVKAMRR